MTAMNIQRDARVETEDGHAGRVRHVVLDPDTHEVTHLGIKTNEGEWLVPMRDVRSVHGNRVLLGIPRARLTRMQALSRADFRPLDGRRARERTEARASFGGAPLLDARDDAVSVGGAWMEEGGNSGREINIDRTPHLMELREERLNVGTEEFQAGAVRVTRRPVERIETIEVPVREERVVLEVLPGSGRVMVGDRVLTEGESIELTLTEEKVVVEKETVAVQDVNIRVERGQRTERLEETVRHEELVVDHEGELARQERDGAINFTTAPTGNGSSTPRE
jgi:uncharacterized protein (TIGR02271 family)